MNKIFISAFQCCLSGFHPYRFWDNSGNLCHLDSTLYLCPNLYYPIPHCIIKIIANYNGRCRIWIRLMFKYKDPDPQPVEQIRIILQGAAEPPEVRCGAAGWLRHHHQPDLPHVRTKKTCRNNKRTVSRKFTPHFFAKLIHLLGPWYFHFSSTQYILNDSKQAFF